MTKTASSTKKKTQKKENLLSACPVNAAGWCLYPFSIDQLKKYVKQKKKAQRMALSGKAKVVSCS